MNIISSSFLTILACIFFVSKSIAQDETDTSMHHLQQDSSLIIDSVQKINITNKDSILAADTIAASKKKSYLLAGLSYLSDNVYLGRKDSVKLPYITFDVSYYFKSGFFIDGSVNYLTGSGNRIDAGTVEAGYSFTSHKYSGEASFSKYFYSSQSTNVKSSLKSSLSYFNSYDFGFITPTLAAYLNFGNKTDVAASLGLEHTFYALNDKLDITPTFSVNASTQNYYNNYYKTRRYTIKRKKKPTVTGTANITGVVENASEFKVLDYEASVPIDFTAGKFIFNASPVYALPINPSVVQITAVRDNGTTLTHYNTEQIQNSFFITIGVNYKFGK